MNFNSDNCYKSQHDKLVDAYINCKINPFTECSCFVGNLLKENDPSLNWGSLRRKADDKISWRSPKVTIIPDNETLANFTTFIYYPYNIRDICRIEQAFLRTYNESYEQFVLALGMDGNVLVDEDALFLAFEEGLRVLKEIHKEKGETIENEFVFTKRKTKELTNE